MFLSILIVCVNSTMFLVGNLDEERYQNLSMRPLPAIMSLDGASHGQKELSKCLCCFQLLFALLAYIRYVLLPLKASENFYFLIELLKIKLHSAHLPHVRQIMYVN